MIGNCVNYDGQQSNGIGRGKQLGSFRFQAKFPGGRLSTAKIEKINEQEMPGTSMGIRKDGNYNIYGDAGSNNEIESLEKHGAFGRVGVSGILGGVSVIEGRFVYAVRKNM